MYVSDIGKLIMIISLIAFVIGFVLFYFGSIPYLGRLPGDIVYKKGNFWIYIPITNSIVIGLVINVLFKIFKKS